MDRGGRLTADEGAAYRYEAELIARRPLRYLREIRYTDVPSKICLEIADETIDEISQEVIGPRFGAYHGYERKNGVWKKK
jgi:hypothetical protein